MQEDYIALGVIVGGTLAVLLWTSLIVWTYRDIRDRSRDLAMQVLSVFLVMGFNFLGLLFYLILRPRETLDETYARSLEMETLLREIGEESACPSCRRFVEKDFLFCPHCQTRLRESCVSCERPLSFSWIACPACGAARPTPELASAAKAPAKGRKSRRAAAPAAATAEATNPAAEATEVPNYQQ